MRPETSVGQHGVRVLSVRATLMLEYSSAFGSAPQVRRREAPSRNIRPANEVRMRAALIAPAMRHSQGRH